MFKSSPLPGERTFGAVVEDLDVEDIDRPKVRKALYELWIDKGLLVFRGLGGGRQAHVRLSEVFGELEVHPIEMVRHPEQPEITVLPYIPGDGIVHLVDGEQRGSYLPWHSDLVYVERINRGGMLRAVQIPSRGGHTGYLDQIELYDALPTDLKSRIEDLHVVYLLDGLVKKFGKPLHIVKLDVRAPPDPTKYEFVAHPMVYTQAETGRKVLNVSPWFAVAIESMENAEGDALLAQIVEHCEDERRAYYHDWRPGDLVLWDNWRMLHCAQGVPPNEPRCVERTMLKGDYQLGRRARVTTLSKPQPISA
jgi:taurine dioxygenase